MLRRCAPPFFFAVNGFECVAQAMMLIDVCKKFNPFAVCNMLLDLAVEYVNAKDNHYDEENSAATQLWALHSHPTFHNPEVLLLLFKMLPQLPNPVSAAIVPSLSLSLFLSLFISLSLSLCTLSVKLSVCLCICACAQYTNICGEVDCFNDLVDHDVYVRRLQTHFLMDWRNVLKAMSSTLRLCITLARSAVYSNIIYVRDSSIKLIPCTQRCCISWLSLVDSPSSWMIVGAWFIHVSEGNDLNTT
jgi:hypothetical protein